MPRTRPPYPPEFREQIVEMVRAGRTPEELAREFEPSVESIRQGLEGGGPAGSGDLAVVGEPLHASVAEGMEAVRPRVQASGEDHQLCGRSCDREPRQGEGGAGVVEVDHRVVGSLSVQAVSAGGVASGKPGSAERGVGAGEPEAARLEPVLQYRVVAARLPDCGPVHQDSTVYVSGATTQGPRAGDPAVQRGVSVRGVRTDALDKSPAGVALVCLGVKPVREPDAGKPHVRFDERVWKTALWLG